MAPDMNLEDVTRPRSLPPLLDSQSKESPDALATADLERIRLAVVTGLVKPVHLHGYHDVQRRIGIERSRHAARIRSFDVGDKLMCFLLQCCQTPAVLSNNLTRYVARSNGG